jgi:hypothetical protein
LTRKRLPNSEQSRKNHGVLRVHVKQVSHLGRKSQSFFMPVYYNRFAERCNPKNSDGSVWLFVAFS